uniref:Uncharacterized protein n=1 Tax=Glossina pallidipes TaxID=7398 RepID=A0A1A9ZHT6_GLOPL
MSCDKPGRRIKRLHKKLASIGTNTVVTSLPVNRRTVTSCVGGDAGSGVDSNKFDSKGHGSILKNSNEQAKVLTDVRLLRVFSKIKDSPAYAHKNVQVRTYSANIPKSMLYKNRILFWENENNTNRKYGNTKRKSPAMQELRKMKWRKEGAYVERTEQFYHDRYEGLRQQTQQATKSRAGEDIATSNVLTQKMTSKESRLSVSGQLIVLLYCTVLGKADPTLKSDSLSKKALRPSYSPFNKSDPIG